ncbi:MAG: hypothetical protein JWM19_6280, partial [Actinomycetia bacterium]|nr:hypothetical protein [Actinomycetes bacterium]
MSEALPVTVIIIAKEPVPGRVKTRLTPPFSPLEAAQLAQAALADTLDAVAAAPVARRVIALAGQAGGWLPPGFEVVPQRGNGLDERLAAAFADAYGRDRLPMVLIGMDTPQVAPELLADAALPLVSGEADASFGPAADGGYWLLGLRAPDWSLLHGVPMSRSDTGQVQLRRLTDAGLRVAMLPELTDMDHAEDAARIAAQVPGSRFARVYWQLSAAEAVSVPSLCLWAIDRDEAAVGRVLPDVLGRIELHLHAPVALVVAIAGARVVVQRVAAVEVGHPVHG